MDPLQFAEVARHTRRRAYRPGDTLFYEGDPAHSLYLVCNGAVNLQRVLGNGEICHLTRSLPLDLVDEVSLPNSAPRMADAVAVGPCEVLVVKGPAFMQVLERSSRFASRYMEGVFERQRRRLREQAMFHSMTVVERVAAMLLEMDEVYGVSEPTGARRLGVSVTQEEMARWVGVQRESVNRTLSSLKRLGAIRTDGRHLVILNELRLRNFGSGVSLR
jgi:CRP-like cAMP-binding protein